jgi:CBS domain-containing protein
MAGRLRQSRVSAFPVIDDDGKVIGVVSEADMLARQVLSTGMLHRGEQDRPEGLTAGDLMTHPAITVSPEDPVEVAARLMYTLQVKRLPVIDPSGRLAGIISRADVLAIFDRSCKGHRFRESTTALRSQGVAWSSPAGPGGGVENCSEAGL